MAASCLLLPQPVMHGVQMLIDYDKWRREPPAEGEASKISNDEMLVIGLSGHATETEMDMAYQVLLSRPPSRPLI